jgi:hypothetical protein
VLLGAFGVSVHIVLDLFQSSTPVLWPLVSESVWIPVMQYLHMGSAAVVTSSATVQVEPADISRFTSFDAPVLTGEGLALSTVLLAPTLVKVLTSWHTKTK